jgi:excisionase family DNA binding protein
MMRLTDLSAPYKTTTNPQPMPDLAEFMTVQEVALKLGFHVNHIRRMRREGDLEGIKFGPTWLITKKSVNEYLKQTAGLEKFDPRRKQEK